MMKMNPGPDVEHGSGFSEGTMTSVIAFAFLAVFLVGMSRSESQNQYRVILLLDSSDTQANDHLCSFTFVARKPAYFKHHLRVYSMLPDKKSESIDPGVPHALIVLPSQVSIQPSNQNTMLFILPLAKNATTNASSRFDNRRFVWLDPLSLDRLLVHISEADGRTVSFDMADRHVSSIAYSILGSSLLFLFAILSILTGVGMVLLNYTELHKKLMASTNSHSTWFAFVFVVVGLVLASTSLLLTYFFYDQMIYVMFAIFCLSSFFSTTCVLSFWINTLFCKLCGRSSPPTISINFSVCGRQVKERLHILHLIIAPCSLALIISWIIFRKDPFVNWPLQSILGFFLVAFVLSQRPMLFSLKIVTIFFCAFVCYDVFFVFISPMITAKSSSESEHVLLRSKRSASNPSIMEAVATGRAGNMNETIPLAFTVKFRCYFPPYYCDFMDHSHLLGFGDALLPGLLIAYTALYDSIWKIARYRTLCTAFTGYVVGSVVTNIVIHIVNSGQPALLYLCPFTLIPVIVVTAICGGSFELQRMWIGQIPDLEQPISLIPQDSDADNKPTNTITGEVKFDRVKLSADSLYTPAV